MYKADNAVILAAGMAIRFVPFSLTKPKGLARVEDEPLIERQIRQIREAGIKDVYVVTGYLAEQYDYLRDSFGVGLIHNSDYAVRNNHSSIFAARDVINNTYICSSDNYFTLNPFEPSVDMAYYALQYSEEHTDEWCVTEDSDGIIDSVHIGGSKSWYMLGHVFWDEAFSKSFLEILDDVYDDPGTVDMLWEHIFINNLPGLKMKARKYPPGTIYEFDTYEDLKRFEERLKAGHE